MPENADGSHAQTRHPRLQLGQPAKRILHESRIESRGQERVLDVATSAEGVRDGRGPARRRASREVRRDTVQRRFRPLRPVRVAVAEEVGRDAEERGRGAERQPVVARSRGPPAIAFEQGFAHLSHAVQREPAGAGVVLEVRQERPQVRGGIGQRRLVEVEHGRGLPRQEDLPRVEVAVDELGLRRLRRQPGGDLPGQVFHPRRQGRLHEGERGRRRDDLMDLGDRSAGEGPGRWGGMDLRERFAHELHLAEARLAGQQCLAQRAAGDPLEREQSLLGQRAEQGRHDQRRAARTGETAAQAGSERGGGVGLEDEVRSVRAREAADPTPFRLVAQADQIADGRTVAKQLAQERAAPFRVRQAAQRRQTRVLGEERDRDRAVVEDEQPGPAAPAPGALLHFLDLVGGDGGPRDGMDVQLAVQP
jgi:hypothetical protein